MYQHIGYKKDLTNKNKLVIDNNVAYVVKKIFDMYVSGVGSKLIVKHLNDNNYLSPSGYRKTGNVQNENKIDYDWNATTICDILKNEVYIGNTVQNKVSVVSYKVKKLRKVEKENYIRVENTHEAIISKETFEKAQIIHKDRAKKVVKQYDYLLRGLIYCKHCGWQMQIVLKVKHNSNRPKIPYIVDVGYKKRDCYTRNLNYYKFEKRILEIVKQICRIYANRTILEETYKKVKDKSIDLLENVKNQITSIDIQIAKINANLDSLYSDKLNGILVDADFIRISQKFIVEREKLESRKSELTDRFQSLQGQKIVKNKSDEEEMNKIINEFLEMQEVNKESLFRLIDKIEIDKDKNVFISFNFAPLNVINENMDEFIEIDEFINNKENREAM